MKQRPPHTAIQAADKATAKNKSSLRSLSTLSPNPVANSSPRTKTSMFPARDNAMGISMNRYGRRVNTCLQFVPYTLPTSQRDSI